MVGSIFIEQLKRSWRTMLIMGAVLALLAFYISAVIQDADVLEQYRALLEQFPPGLLGAFGVGDVEVLTTPEGFMGFGFFTYGILILAAYAVIAGLNVTANDEDEGSMDVVLSLPVPRWRVIVEKFAAYTVIAIGLALLSWLGIAGGSTLLPEDMSLDLSRMAVACFNMIPTILAILAFTVLVSVIVPTRAMAAGISGGAVVLSYFLYIVRNAASGALVDGLGQLSVFTYFDAERVVIDGLVLVNTIVLLTATVIFVLLSLFAFERRDIA